MLLNLKDIAMGYGSRCSYHIITLTISCVTGAPDWKIRNFPGVPYLQPFLTLWVKWKLIPRIALDWESEGLASTTS